MTVLAEALPRGDAIVVDDTQRAVADPVRVVVVGKGEGMKGLQLAVI
jgi:hypothetical protein